jgi:hypothetical protein
VEIERLANVRKELQTTSDVAPSQQMYLDLSDVIFNVTGLFGDRIRSVARFRSLLERARIRVTLLVCSLKLDASQGCQL